MNVRVESIRRIPTRTMQAMQGRDGWGEATDDRVVEEVRSTDNANPATGWDWKSLRLVRWVITFLPYESYNNNTS
jgi:hypothetical protein